MYTKEIHENIPKHDHISVTITTKHLIVNSKVVLFARRIILQTTSATTSGRTQ